MNFIKVSADEVIYQAATNSYQVTGQSQFYFNVNFIGGIRGNQILSTYGDVVQIGGQSFRNLTIVQTGAPAPQMDTI